MTILHDIANANAAGALKYLVVKVNGAIGPYAQGDGGYTFLHLATRYARFDIVTAPLCRGPG
jgi:hypothetical protein